MPTIQSKSCITIRCQHAFTMFLACNILFCGGDVKYLMASITIGIVCGLIAYFVQPKYKDHGVFQIGYFSLIFLILQNCFIKPFENDLLSLSSLALYIFISVFPSLFIQIWLQKRK